MARRIKNIPGVNPENADMVAPDYYSRRNAEISQGLMPQQPPQTPASVGTGAQFQGLMTQDFANQAQESRERNVPLTGPLVNTANVQVGGSRQFHTGPQTVNKMPMGLAGGMLPGVATAQMAQQAEVGKQKAETERMGMAQTGDTQRAGIGAQAQVASAGARQQGLLGAEGMKAQSAEDVAKIRAGGLLGAAQLKAGRQMGGYTKDEATGQWLGPDGKIVDKDREQRLNDHATRMDAIMQARGLDPSIEKASVPAHWYNPLSWAGGHGQAHMWDNQEKKFVQVAADTKDVLPDYTDDKGKVHKKEPRYDPLTPEERQAMTEAAGIGGAPKQPGQSQTHGVGLIPPAGPGSVSMGGRTVAKQPGQPIMTSSTPAGAGLMPAQPAAAQSGTVTMTFPDGKRKQVPAADQQRYAAMGGKVQ